MSTVVIRGSKMRAYYMYSTGRGSEWNNKVFVDWKRCPSERRFGKVALA